MSLSVQDDNIVQLYARGYVDLAGGEFVAYRLKKVESYLEKQCNRLGRFSA